MNPDRFVPMIGSPELSPPIAPPTKPPMVAPRPVPIFSRTMIARSRSCSMVGLSAVRAQIAAMIAPSPAISVARAPMPIKAAGPVAPTPARIRQAPDMDRSRTDNDAAVSIDALTPSPSIIPRIAARPATTAVMIPMAA